MGRALGDHPAIFLDLSVRLLTLDVDGGVSDEADPLMQALNHPVGHVAQGLVDFWFLRSPQDKQGLPDDVRPIFSLLCDKNISKYQHGRLILAGQCIALFRVDQSWTEQHLLPYFDWRSSVPEALAVWTGFLRTLRLYRPLMEALKTPFLDCARRYEVLGKARGMYAAILTFAALNHGDLFSTAELQAAMNVLPQKGLEDCAQSLARTMEGAGEQRAQHWKNRIVPYFHAIWPKSNSATSSGVSLEFARLCIATGELFPEAVELLRTSLTGTEHVDLIAHLLLESASCTSFPEAALEFLNSIVPADPPWLTGDLGHCLDQISTAWPSATADRTYSRLRELVRRKAY